MSLDYRTWGETQTCKGCRYWSEMIAKCEGGGPMQAYCLNGRSDRANSYTYGHDTCEAYKEGSLGAIDAPGGNPYEDEAEQQ